MIVPASIIIGILVYFQLGDVNTQLLKQTELTISGEVLYVENANSNNISVIDLATNTIIRNIPVGNSPHDLKISQNQKTLYSTDTDSGTISVINTTTNKLIRQIQTNSSVHGITIFNDTLYAGDVYGGKVLVFKDGAIKGEIKVGSGPEYMEVSPSGKFLYVANLWSPISVVDLDETKVIKEIDSGKTPHGLSFTSDGSRLFIVNMKSNTLSVIDAEKHEIIKTINVGENPEYVALTPHERFAYVTNLESDTVSIVDTSSFEVVNEIPVGDGPHGIAFSSDGDFAYISNMKGNDVSVINTTSNEVVATIPVGIEPHQVVIKRPLISIVSENSITPVYVDIANDPDEQSRGLMFRKSLEWNNGMLFVFDDEKQLSFWMKNTYIPLDMIFINNEFKIIDIKEDAQPCLEKICPKYSSKEPAKYVLEVNAGFVQKNKIKIGDRILI